MAAFRIDERCHMSSNWDMTVLERGLVGFLLPRKACCIHFVSWQHITQSRIMSTTGGLGREQGRGVGDPTDSLGMFSSVSPCGYDS